MDIVHLENLALEYGSFSIIKYFRETDSDYSIYQIDYANSTLIWFGGLNSSEVKKVSIDKFPWGTSSIKAAYRNLDEKEFHIRPVNLFLYDPIIFSEEYDIEQCKVLLFHEIVHLIQLTDYYLELDVKLNSDDNDIGIKIETYANDVYDKTGIWGSDEFHNKLFGSLLNYYFRNYNPMRRAELLKKALAHNFLDNEVTDYE